MIRQLERPFLHPFLFAVYPIALMYAQNEDQLTRQLALAPTLLSLLLALLTLGGSQLVLRDWYKSACFTSIFVTLFFFFNQALIFFNRYSSFGISRGRYKTLIFVVVVVACLFFIWRSRRSFKPATPPLNVAAVFLVSFNVVSIIVPSLKAGNKLPTESETASVESQQAADDAPDIYYIILDGYAGADTLRDVVGFDNSEFEDFLRSQGFYVVPEAYSNYYQTNLSLPSSLNMTHLEPSRDFIIPLRRAPDNRVSRYLRDRGYSVVDPSKAWSGSSLGHFEGSSASLADLFRSEFALTLAKSSMLDALMTRMQWYSESVRRKVLFGLRHFRETPDLDVHGPKFAYIYLLTPHPPYVFGPNGEDTGQVDFGKAFDVRLSSWDNKAGYVGQVQFINNQLMEIIPEILAKYPDDDSPVMIIQGDHGPTFVRSDQTDSEYYKVRFGIINAYLLPRGGNEALYDEITPVNSFRLVFNEYFGESFPLLEDRSYFAEFETPYDLVDVTEKLRAPGLPIDSD
jgi:hypothetical protein